MSLNKVNMHQQPKTSLLKVVLLGDGGVGKSCLMNRFVNDSFDIKSYHTIGVEFLNKDIVVKGETYTLQIWDTAGQERFKSLRTPFYRGADICILTYSIDDKKSFDNLSTWKKEFLYYADIHPASPFPFIIVGNKVDVEQDQRQVLAIDVKSWCEQDGNPPFIETSAKDAINVEQAFHVAVENWQSLDEKLDRPQVGSTVDLRKLNQKKTCCG